MRTIFDRAARWAMPRLDIVGVAVLIVGFFVIAPIAMTGSFTSVITNAVALWPTAIGFALLGLWYSPALKDFLLQVDYTPLPSMVRHGNVEPLITSMRKANSPDAERLRQIANKRLRIALLAFFSVIPWWLLLAAARVVLGHN